MEIIQPINRDNFGNNIKLMRKYLIFEQLIKEVSQKNIPDNIAEIINLEIKHLNSIEETNKIFKKKFNRIQAHILKTLEKRLKIVPINFYQNNWMIIGMSVFGIPLGVAFGLSQDNMAFIGIGLPLGMVIGIAIGKSMDKKAKEENRQLNVEITRYW